MWRIAIFTTRQLLKNHYLLYPNYEMHNLEEIKSSVVLNLLTQIYKVAARAGASIWSSELELKFPASWCWGTCRESSHWDVPGRKRWNPCIPDTQSLNVVTLGGTRFWRKQILSERQRDDIWRLSAGHSPQLGSKPFPRAGLHDFSHLFHRRS